MKQKEPKHGTKIIVGRGDASNEFLFIGKNSKGSWIVESVDDPDDIYIMEKSDAKS